MCILSNSNLMCVVLWAIRVFLGHLYQVHGLSTWLTILIRVQKVGVA